jgi:hypothetical protein
MEDHLKNPTVNTTSYAEERLANAVAEYILVSTRFQEYMTQNGEENEVRE